MFPINIDIQLPSPWKGQRFKTEKVGYINYLVGPNGVGKSRFIDSIKGLLPSHRLLGADRIASLFHRQGGYSGFLHGSSPINEGFNRSNFSNTKLASMEVGSGVDAFIILEERLDIRIKVEATLTQVLGREIRLEWESGKLVPMAYNIRQQEVYSIHKDESHGIKELLVLLTHIYDDSHQTLIIDEPELNLHPQYQAFLIQEIRKAAGNPSKAGKKIFFLVTHSPFIIDIRNQEDLSSIICFHADYSSPSHLFNMPDVEVQEFSKIIPRLNVHHKQLFFAEFPIFVEGIFDAQYIKSLQESRGISLEGSGSCVIDVGGNEELPLYFKLSKAFNKKANFIYDLDSIFNRSLRSNAASDHNIKLFLATIGAGVEFQKYCGELESLLTNAAQSVIEENSTELPEANLINHLKEMKGKYKGNDLLKKHRIAILLHLGAHKANLDDMITELKVAEIIGKLETIAKALQKQNVYLLKNGALEHYLPSYTGNLYIVDDGIKAKTIQAEMIYLNTYHTDDELRTRYGGLFDVIATLPIGLKVDYISNIKSHLGSIIFKIQRGFASNLINSANSLISYLGTDWAIYSKIINIDEFASTNKNEFSCTIKLLDKWGLGEKHIIINHNTNSAMGNYELTPIV